MASIQPTIPLILTGARQTGKSSLQSSLLAAALAARPEVRVTGLRSQWHWEDGRVTIRLALWNRPAAARRVA